CGHNAPLLHDGGLSVNAPVKEGGLYGSVIRAYAWAQDAHDVASRGAAWVDAVGRLKSNPRCRHKQTLNVGPDGALIPLVTDRRRREHRDVAACLCVSHCPIPELLEVAARERGV